MPHRHRKLNHRVRGYSVVELLAVTVIVGILATIATYGVRRYILASKSAEAIHMLGAIKSAQEAWRDETFIYLNVSGTVKAIHPQENEGGVGTSMYRWDRNTPTVANWQLLNLETNQFVRFGYSCIAGGPAGGAEFPSAADLNIQDSNPFAAGIPNEEWYVARAIGNLDGDGHYSTFVTTSFSSEIYSEREDE